MEQEEKSIRKRKTKTKDRPYRTPYYVKLKDTCEKLALFKGVIHDSGPDGYRPIGTPPKRRAESPTLKAPD
jgi:hypothetical protein